MRTFKGGSFVVLRCCRGKIGISEEIMTAVLHKLWDGTLAGPMSDTGFGMLRKHDSFSVSESPLVKISGDIPVTRSVFILRSNSDFLELLG
ncbi:Dormancy-associated protein-like 4, partial [Cucurbita argyrosperma subsp. argyrosperma]